MNVFSGIGWRGLSGNILPGSSTSDNAWEASLPGRVIVSLFQPNAGDARCLVGEGDEVREGMIIGSPPPNGVSIHAPVPGVVEAIIEIELPGGIATTGVVIRTGGEFDILGRDVSHTAWEGLVPSQLIDLISDMGVEDVRDLGESLITRIRRMEASENKIAAIINLVPSEPLSLTNQYLLKKKPDSLIEGGRILSHMFPSMKIVYAVPRESRQIGRKLGHRLRKTGLSGRIKYLRGDYPQGDPAQVACAILGKELQQDTLLEDRGIFMIDASTLFSLYEAVALRKPMIERYVTLAGDALASARVIKARIGSSIENLIADTGVVINPVERIVYGGPLRGIGMPTAKTPLSKYYDSVLVLTKSRIFPHIEEKDPPGIEACFQCGLCALHCPVRINPMRVFKLLENELPEHAWNEGLYACTGCGICSYICPSDISLTQRILQGKDAAGRVKE